MSFYTTQPVGKRHTNIIEAATGEHVCQLRNTEVRAWLFKAERARAEAIAYRAEMRAVRLADARAYLAKRAARPANTQLSLF